MSCASTDERKVALGHVTTSIDNSSLSSICRRDPGLIGTVACSYEEFVLEDDAVINFLESHPDIKVRENLAGNPFVPKPVSHRIVQGDPGRLVRGSARQVML